MEIANAVLMNDGIDFDYLEDNDGMPLVHVGDQDQAEAHLKTLDYWRYEAECIEKHANAQIERANQWKEEQLKTVNKRIHYHESGLIAFLQMQDKKTIKLINGTIKRIAGRDRVDVNDFDTLLKWSNEREAGLIRTKQEPDKKAIMDYIKANGEQPEGVELVTGDDSFKIETYEAGK